MNEKELERRQFAALMLQVIFAHRRDFSRDMARDAVELAEILQAELDKPKPEETPPV